MHLLRFYGHRDGKETECPGEAINTFLLGLTGINSVTFTVIILYNKYRFCIRPSK